nr:DnaJ domain-containing protein [Halarcobacter mediterraneus]
MAQLISSLIKWAIFFGILYLIFTNFGTFLIILFVLISIAYFAFYQFKKKLREASQEGTHFKFTFNGQDFSQAGANNFNFNDFQEQFRNGNFQNPTSFSELEEAKDFFGFSQDPTKEEIKKRYKELARKYHPDINDHGDELMQKLNHYKDILLKAFS